MISPERLYHLFQESGIRFYTGVPDSLLKDFLKYVQDHAIADDHVITANEGLSLSLASGYHFSTGRVPLVYLQNSGLGNIVNPLTSLAGKDMCGIPMLLMIGWRGRPGVKDEPQHKKMGSITSSLLEMLDIPLYTLSENETECFDLITAALSNAKAISAPVALLVPEKIFEAYAGIEEKDPYTLNRETVIKELIAVLQGDEAVVCTTGKTGREFYEQNLAAGKKIGRFFLSTGAMGHAGHIALGITLGKDQKTVLLDGDGAFMMHMGGLPAIARLAGNDLIHILINNGSHESVGGQPTHTFSIDCCVIAAGCGYTRTVRITNETEWKAWLSGELFPGEKQFVEIRTSRESREDLARPTGEPAEWKKALMASLEKK